MIKRIVILSTILTIGFTSILLNIHTQVTSTNVIKSDVEVIEKDRPIKEYVTNVTVTYKTDKVIQTKSNTNAYYNPYDLSQVSNASPNLLWSMLEGTSFQTENFVALLIDGEECDNPVNAVFMIAVARWESGHGYSNLAQNNNNIYSIRQSRGWKYFNDKEECLNYTLDLMSNYYMNINSKHYTGKSVYQVGQRYCEGNTWASEVNSMVQEILNQ